MSFQPVSAWCQQQVTARAGKPVEVAYFAFGASSGGSSYPQSERVDVGDVASVETAVLAACASLQSSAEAEGRPLSRVKVWCYGPKGVQLASTVVRLADDAAADGAHRSASDDARASELVAVVAQLRMSVGDALAQNRQLAQGAMNLGLSALSFAERAVQTSAADKEKLGELVGALAIAESSKQSPISEFLAAAGPALPAVLAGLAARLSSSPSES